MKSSTLILIVLGLIAALLGSLFYGGGKGWLLRLVATVLSCALIYIVIDAFRKGEDEHIHLALAILSGLIGAGLVFAAFKISVLNWVVDAPGWLVSRFLPIDFHEGEGALGFFLSLLLSWASASAAAWFAMFALWKRYSARRRLP